MTMRDSGVLFYLALGIWVAADFVINYTALSLTGFAVARYAMLGVAVFLLLLKIACFQRYSNAQVLGVMALLLLAIAVSLRSHTEAMLTIALFAVSGQSLRYRLVAKAVFFASTVSVALVLLLHVAGFLSDAVSLRDGVARHSLGFKHPNMLAAALLSSTVSLFAWRWENRCWYHYLYVVVLLAFIEFSAHSRAVELVLLVLLVLATVDGKVSLFNRGGMCWVIVVAAAASVAIAVFYDVGNDTMRRIDLVISERLYYSNVYYDLYGYSLFGQRINLEAAMMGSVYTGTLDNAYVHIAVGFGLVPLALFVAAMSCATRRFAKQGDRGMVCACVLMSLFGLSETYMYVVSFDFAVVSCAIALYGSTAFALPTNKERCA